MARPTTKYRYEGETPVGLDWDHVREQFMANASPEERVAQEYSLQTQGIMPSARRRSTK